MGGGSSHETQYTYVDNTARDREEALRRLQREQRRLENERKQRETAEKLRIAQEKEQEEERRRAEYKEQRQREIAQEEARRREEEEKRLRLEKELSLRRAELFDYQFGNKTRLDNFRGLPIDDVTQLNIGVFGQTGSGKSCFINTCERAVRETEKGSAPDKTTGGNITLQDYLPEMFFHLVNTRGFFDYNANETVEFQNILYGKLQPGDNVIRPHDGQDSAPEMDLHESPAFANRMHGVIFVAKANDPRLREGVLKDYLKPVRDILRKTGIAPITVVTHLDKMKTEEECENALYEASAATGSSPSHTFFVANYTRENNKRNPETERIAFDILDCALLTAERAVKIMKQKQRKKEEDEMMRALEGTSVSGQVSPDSAEGAGMFPNEMDQQEQQEENLQRQLREMGRQLTNFEEQLREREKEISNLQQQNFTLESQLRDKEGEINELEMSLLTTQQAISKQRHQGTCDWVIARDEIQISEKCLGRGGWGSVYEGMYCGSTIAVKQIHELILSPHNTRLFEREMSIASRCRHPCLLQFIGATNDGGSPLFVTELMEASLRELLQQQELSETEVAVISLDVAKAINYLHEKKPEPIIHRDVSSANVLLWRQGDQWRGKVSDYGTANFMQNTMTVAPGAMIYSAPEALTSNQTVKVDVYSFGVLLCEMNIRELPDPRRRDEQVALVTNRALRGLVRRCLQTVPEMRPSMLEIIDSLRQFNVKV